MTEPAVIPQGTFCATEANSTRNVLYYLHNITKLTWSQRSKATALEQTEKIRLLMRPTDFN
jgi:hypothetical protein